MRQGTIPLDDHHSFVFNELTRRVVERLQFIHTDHGTANSLGVTQDTVRGGQGPQVAIGVHVAEGRAPHSLRDPRNLLVEGLPPVLQGYNAGLDLHVLVERAVESLQKGHVEQESYEKGQQHCHSALHGRLTTDGMHETEKVELGWPDVILIREFSHIG